MNVLRVVSEAFVFIPMAVTLVKYVVISVRERNWKQLVAIAFDFVKRAESLYVSGADKKRWVMSMVLQAADSINYSIDQDTLSSLIEDIVKVTKCVNANDVDANDVCAAE